MNSLAIESSWFEVNKQLFSVLNVCHKMTFAGTCREHGKAYTVYLITVTQVFSDDSEHKWDVYRRYSDFHDLHLTLAERVGRRAKCKRTWMLTWNLISLQYEDLHSQLALPSKRTFNNMNKDFLEKRKQGLSTYLQVR